MATLAPPPSSERAWRRQIEIKLNFTISLIISDDGLISFLNFYSCSHLIIPKLMWAAAAARGWRPGNPPLDKTKKKTSPAWIEELRITLLITRCFIFECCTIHDMIYPFTPACDRAISSAASEKPGLFTIERDGLKCDQPTGAGVFKLWQPAIGN